MGQSLGRPAVTNPEVGHGQDTETPAGNPLPLLIHAELPKELVSRRLIIVGDVHGCADELQTLLHKVKFTKGSDVLIFNGDIINKGPKSVQVIDQIQSLDGVVVRGNQDDKALAQYVQWKAGKPLEEAQKWLQDLGDQRAEWLRQLPFSLSVPSRKLVVVHAGLIPGVPLQQQSLKTLTELRTLPASTQSPDSSTEASQQDLPGHCQSKDPSKSRQAESSSPNEEQSPQSLAGPKSKCAEGQKQRPWGSVWEGPEHVVFGHDAGRKLQAWPCATGLDTGCCYGGQLTALIIPAQDHQAGSPAEKHQGYQDGKDSHDEPITAEPCASRQPDSHTRKPAGDSVQDRVETQQEMVDSSPKVEKENGQSSAAGEEPQGYASPGAVPSLSDWDASFVLVPAKKVYSKKKL